MGNIVSFAYSILTLFSIIFFLAFLYIAGTITSYIVFYAKESIIEAGKAPIAGTVFHHLFYFKTLFDFHTNIARQHRTFRIINHSHVDLYTADPANIEHILKTNFKKYTKAGYNNVIIKDLLGDGIFAVDGEKWRRQRKLSSSEFSTRILRDFSSTVFRSNATKLAKRIEDAVTAASVVDMQDLFMKSTMDSIFKVGFGVELNTLSGTDEMGARFSKAFDNSNHIVFCRYVDLFWKAKRFLNINVFCRYVDLFWKAKRFLNIGLERQLKNNIKFIDDFVFQLIRTKRKQMMTGTADKEDILSRFIIASEEVEEINDRYLRDIILNFLVAGKDTSANTLSWFFYMLCKHPLVQEKIAQEVREVVAQEGHVNDAGSDLASNLTDQVLERMQYLHAALTETLRLYPAVPLDAKCSEGEDTLPDGYKVKKGDGVNYMCFAMGRMTYLWGDDAEDFRPERWIENGESKPESPFKFIAFNAGPRICLGKEFAYKQMKILAAVLLRQFRFRLADETRTVTYRTMFTLHIDGGLPLVVFKR